MQLKPCLTTDEEVQVLLVEDDERLASLTAHYLREHGLTVAVAHTGPEGLAQASRHRYDIILLDLMLPGRDGMEVCHALRERSGIPIIMVTSRREEADRVLGLEAGADDYLLKPYSPRELLARIRAQVRRARGLAGPATQLIHVGRLRLDPSSLSASVDGKPLSLTTYEFLVLRVLAERAGRVLSREQIIETINGNAEDVFDRSIDVHIFRLRQKMEVDPRNPKLIRTVRGMGYMLCRGEES